MTCPLPAWGRPRAALWLLAVAPAVAFTLAPLLVNGPVLALWNASASVPVGLYFVQPGAPLRVGDYAVSSLPEAAAELADARRYLPRSVLLIKPVAAEPGSTVCRIGAAVTLDGHHLADALPVDRRGRPMPVWQGCHPITSGEILLINPHVPDSFDGRYFGPTNRNLVRGRAFPLLTFGTRITGK